jgi:hypothetical protein
MIPFFTSTAPHPSLPPEGEGAHSPPLWGRVRGGAGSVGMFGLETQTLHIFFNIA